MEDSKKCPYCGQEIKAVAIKCKHCGKWLDDSYKETAVPSENPAKPKNDQADKSPQTVTINRNYLIIGVVALAAIFGVIYAISVDKSNHQQASEVTKQTYSNPSYSSSTINRTNPVETSDPYDASNDVYDYWVGQYRIDGCVYRLCDTRAILKLEKRGENYVGTIDLVLGFRDEMDRVSTENGELTGQVRARDTGNGLLVSLVNYRTVKGDVDMFSGEYGVSFKEGDQVFLITYSNSTYTTKALGNMNRFFDGCEITTTK